MVAKARGAPAKSFSQGSVYKRRPLQRVVNAYSIHLKSFKIRYDKVLKVLKGINPSKSANGIAPVFWKMTADVVALAVTKLFKMIVRKGNS